MMLVCIGTKAHATGHITRYVRTEFKPGSAPINYGNNLNGAHQHIQAGDSIAVMYSGEEALEFLKEIGHGGSERKEQEVWAREETSE